MVVFYLGASVPTSYTTSVDANKTYLPNDQDQLLLLPPSIREWVEPGDLAHLIDDVVECLDLGA
ncbi:MAG TPA: hypothetical protein VMU49_08905 [Candidatus Acidoferrales bacterium]|nr:hypothetical protein [Candidatus Acidoferrales bacterium]